MSCLKNSYFSNVILIFLVEAYGYFITGMLPFSGINFTCSAEAEMVERLKVVIWLPPSVWPGLMVTFEGGNPCFLYGMLLSTPMWSIS